MQIIVFSKVFWVSSSLRFKDFHRITWEIPNWIGWNLIKIVSIQYLFFCFNNPLDDAIILISIKHIIQIFLVIINTLWLRFVLILLCDTRATTNCFVCRVFIYWGNGTYLRRINHNFGNTILLLDFLKVVVLIGRGFHPRIISLNYVFEALICQINPDWGWKLDVCQYLLRMKSALGLKISVDYRKTLNERLLVTDMRVEIIDSHFRQYSFHFTSTFLSYRFHLSLRYVYINHRTEYIIIVVDKNYLKSFRFNRLSITYYIFQSIIKLNLFNLQCTTHFLLLSDHSIHLDVGIFIWKLIGAEELFIVYIYLFRVLGTVENSVPLYLFFLSYRFSLIIIKDSSHNSSSSFVSCISGTEEYSKLVRVILKSAYVSFSLILWFDERRIIIFIFIIYYRSITLWLPYSRFLNLLTLWFTFNECKFLCYCR